MGDNWIEICFPKPKAYSVLIILCLTLTLLDIIIVECYYRYLAGWDRIWIWHTIYTAIFILTPLFVAIWIKSWVPIATWFYFLFGLEDTLFYGLQGYLPKQYPGIQIFGIWEPTLNQVLQLNLLGLVVIIAYTLINWQYYIPERFFTRLKDHSKLDTHISDNLSKD
jgi:hypothetical protein